MHTSTLATSITGPLPRGDSESVSRFGLPGYEENAKIFRSLVLPVVFHSLVVVLTPEVLMQPAHQPPDCRSSTDPSQHRSASGWHIRSGNGAKGRCSEAQKWSGVLGTEDGGEAGEGEKPQGWTWLPNELGQDFTKSISSGRIQHTSWTGARSTLSLEILLLENHDPRLR